MKWVCRRARDQAIAGIVLFTCFSSAAYFLWLESSLASLIPLTNENSRKKGIYEQKVQSTGKHEITIKKSRLAQRIATRCKGHYGELRTDIPQNSTLSNILVSDRYKTLFCFVPKVACGNWKRIFLVLNGQFNSTTEISGFTAHESGLVDTLDNYSTNEIRLKLQTYKKIVFVREPLERVLSAYRNKFTTVFHRKIFNQRVGKKIITMYRKNLTKEVTDDDHVTFNEFVKYLIGLSPMEKPDIHWDQQYNICTPCDINYDFIGKYETLKSDVERALGIMGASEKVTFPDIGKKRKGQETTTLMKKLYSQISEQEFVRLKKIYELDYEFFEYRKPIYSEVLNG